jgi:hypothetical protein
MSIVEKFSKHLSYVDYPKNKKSSWHISGILPKFSNQIHKYDVRGMKIEDNGHLTKRGSTYSKANKIVFETRDEWLIFDTEEFHRYLYDNKIKIIHLNKMVKNLNKIWVLSKDKP